MPTPQPAAAASFDPVAEIRQRYGSQVAGMGDAKLATMLLNPGKFRMAFPERAGMSDQQIRDAMGSYFRAESPTTPTGLANQALKSYGIHDQVSGPPQEMVKPQYNLSFGEAVQAGALANHGVPLDEAEAQAAVPPPVTKTIPGVLSGVGGYPKIGHGVAEIIHGHSRDDRYRGGTDLLQGTMQAATPLMMAGGEMLESAPAMLKGAGTAMKALIPAILAGKTAEGITAGAGGSPAAQEFAGTAATAIAPFAAGPAVAALKNAGVEAAAGVGNAATAGARRMMNGDALIRFLGGGPAVMREAPMSLDRPLVGSATKGEVAQYAANKGVELLPGQATGSRPLQGLQSLGERALVGGREMQVHADAQRTNFARALDDYLGRVGANRFPDAQTAGAQIQTDVRTAMEGLKADAQKDFATWGNQVGDQPVDISGLKEKYGAQLQGMRRALQNEPDDTAGPIRSILNKAANFGADDPAPLTVSDLQQMRSAYWEKAHDYRGNVPERVNAIAAQITQDLDNALAAKAKETGTLKLWRAANAKWAQLEQDFNTPSSDLYKILKESNPERVAAMTAERGTLGGNRSRIQALLKYGIDLRPVRATVAGNIADAGFGIRKGRMSGYGPDFLEDLFDNPAGPETRILGSQPSALEELKALGRVARAIRYEQNPSGTSNVMEAGEQTRRLTRGLGEIATGRIGRLGVAGLGFALGGPAGAAVGLAPEILAETVPARLSLNPDFIEAATGVRPKLTALEELKRTQRRLPAPKPTKALPPAGSALMPSNFSPRLGAALLAAPPAQSNR